VRTVRELGRCASPPRWGTEVGRVGRAGCVTRLNEQVSPHRGECHCELATFAQIHLVRYVLNDSFGHIPMPHRTRAVGGPRMDDNGRQQIRGRSTPIREGASLRKQVS
jgi:hypothetical protein